MPDQPVRPGAWYWDRRNQKAYVVQSVTGDAVELSTRWHREEVADAMSGGALVPVEEIRLDRVETAFDLHDSFRFEIDAVAPPARQPGEE